MGPRSGANSNQKRGGQELFRAMVPSYLPGGLGEGQSAQPAQLACRQNCESGPLNLHSWEGAAKPSGIRLVLQRLVRSQHETMTKPVKLWPASVSQTYDPWIGRTLSALDMVKAGGPSDGEHLIIEGKRLRPRGPSPNVESHNSVKHVVETGGQDLPGTLFCVQPLSVYGDGNPSAAAEPHSSGSKTCAGVALRPLSASVAVSSRYAPGVA